MTTKKMGSTPVAAKSLMSAKFVIAGGFGVGKTTFVHAISEIPPLRTEEHLTEAAADVDDASLVSTKKSTTVAMDFGRISIDDALMVYLFGTPGQSRFSFMWDTIIEGALGAIVLIDPRRLEDSYGSIDYFESRDVPFVVAQNRFPGSEVLPDHEMRDVLAVPPDIPVTNLNATETESVKTALIVLIDHIMGSLAANGTHKRVR